MELPEELKRKWLKAIPLWSRSGKGADDMQNVAFQLSPLLLCLFYFGFNKNFCMYTHRHTITPESSMAHIILTKKKKRSSQDDHRARSWPGTAYLCNPWRQFLTLPCNPAILNNLQLLQSFFTPCPLTSLHILLLVIGSLALPSTPLFSLPDLYYRELTLAKHIPRLPCLGSGRRGWETGMQEGGKNQGIFPTCCLL